MPHLPLMRWNYQGPARGHVAAGGHTAARRRRPTTSTTPPGSACARSPSDRPRRANADRKNERIYLGGFEIYREYDGDGSTVTLERETLHVMDDQQRVALVETRTHGDDGSPAQLIRYQFGNHLGSASLELDEPGRSSPTRSITPTAARPIRP